MIFDLTSLSACICTETTSTTIYGGCASLFSQCLMGKVLWRGFNINKHLMFENLLEGLQQGRVWSTIISSCLMWSCMSIQFWRNCSLAASRHISRMMKLAEKQRRLNPLNKTREKEKWRKMWWLTSNSKGYLWNSLSSLWKLMFDNYLTLIEEKNDISNLVKPSTSRKTVPEKKDSMKILTRKLENCSAC